MVTQLGHKVRIQTRDACLSLPRVPRHGPGDRGRTRVPTGKKRACFRGEQVPQKIHADTPPPHSRPRHCQFRGAQAQAVGQTGDCLLHPPTDPAACWHSYCGRDEAPNPSPPVPHTHTGRFHHSLTGGVHSARWRNPFRMGLVHSLQDLVSAQEITF